MGRTRGPIFSTREQAGTLLGRELSSRGFAADTVVLGLLRGGVPVAAALAAVLDAELGALAVRKLGVPHHEELAFGAVASFRGSTVRHLVPQVHRHAQELCTATELLAVEARANTETARLAAYFAVFAPDPAGRRVVLCDDGLATGATMRAACDAVNLLGPAQIVVALPVAPNDSVHRVEPTAFLIALHAINDFTAVGAHYQDFSAVAEATAEHLLREAAFRHGAP